MKVAISANQLSTLFCAVFLKERQQWEAVTASEDAHALKLNYCAVSANYGCLQGDFCD